MTPPPVPVTVNERVVRRALLVTVTVKVAEPLAATVDGLTLAVTPVKLLLTLNATPDENAPTGAKFTW